MALLQNKYLSGHLDAAVPLRSAETVLQNAIAQRQQRRERVTSAMLVADPSLDCMGMIWSKTNLIGWTKNAALKDQLWDTKLPLCLPFISWCWLTWFASPGCLGRLTLWSRIDCLLISALGCVSARSPSRAERVGHVSYPALRFGRVAEHAQLRPALWDDLLSARALHSTCDWKFRLSDGLNRATWHGHWRIGNCNNHWQYILRGTQEGI